MKMLAGRVCYAAIDLSSTTDITALALVFPPEHIDPDEAARAIARMDDVDGENPESDEGTSLPLVRTEDEWRVIWRYYMPADNMRDRAETDRASYDLWADQDFIVRTPGNVVDYDYIHRDVKELSQTYNIRKVAIDRWGATHMSTLLMKDGFDVVGFGQGYASMSAPSKFLEWLVYSASLVHGGNPVSDWMSQNVVVTEDEARNIKPVKSKSTGRIDGIVALIMAIGVALTPDDIDTSEPRITIW
jgi:phage terminase large subunit-like protein